MGEAWTEYVKQTIEAPPDAPVIEFIRQVSADREDPLALDLGCGGGRHLRYLLQQGIQAVGLDSCPAAVQESPFYVLLHNIREPLPFADRTFDWIICWGVFLHLPPSAQPSLFSETYRILKPGGALLLDFLRPDDFRNKLGSPLGENYNNSPFIEGITDYFCKEEQILSLGAAFEVVAEQDISFSTADGEYVSQGCFWFQRPKEEK